MGFGQKCSNGFALADKELAREQSVFVCFDRKARNARAQSQGFSKYLG